MDRSTSKVDVTIALTANFKTPPYKHQLLEFEKHAEDKARALLWQMRTGKTKLVIDTACHLYQQDKIDTVIVFAPNGVHENWIIRELPTHHWDSEEWEGLVWKTEIASKSKSNKRIDRRNAFWAKAKALVKSKKLTWFAFNSESMSRDDVKKLSASIVRNNRVLVVFDESHDYRTPGSKRTKMARALSKRCLYKRILTGTVVTNSPLHAYSQYELLKPGALGFDTADKFNRQYGVFEDRRTKTGRSYKKRVGYKNLEQLRARIGEWSSVILRSDCEDLPDIVRRTVSIMPTQEQIKAYAELVNNYYVELEAGEVSATEAAVRLIKLQQIMSGFLIDEYETVHKLPGGNPRLDAMSKEVYLSPGKVIVWCQFRQDLKWVAQRLRQDGHEIVEYHGGTSDADRAKARRLFAPGADNDVKALVGQAQSAGQGLDLSGAGRIVWYSHTFNAIIRTQADERATAIGGDNVSMTDLVMPGIDKYILDRVTQNISVADDVAGKGLKRVLAEVRL